MALYQSVEQEEYIRQLTEAIQRNAHPESMEGLGSENRFNVYEE